MFLSTGIQFSTILIFFIQNQQNRTCIKKSLNWYRDTRPGLIALYQSQNGRIFTYNQIFCTHSSLASPGTHLFFQNLKLFTRLAFEFPGRKQTFPKRHVLSSCNMKRNHPVFDVLEDRNGLSMGHPLQDLPIDGKNFIP